jgi:DNA damage-inducible protein 1
MQVTVTTLSGDVFSIEVPDDLELENFKAFCEAESGVASKDMVILYNGKPLLDDKTSMKDYGVKNGDMVVMEKIKKENPAAAQGAGSFKLPDFSKIKIPGGPSGSGGSAQAGAAGPSRSSKDENDPAWIREMLKSNPDQLAMLKQNNPRLAEALESSLEEFSKVRNLF